MSLRINRRDKKHKHFRSAPIAELRIELEALPDNKASVCAKVLRSLPEWLGIAKYRSDIRPAGS